MVSGNRIGCSGRKEDRGAVESRGEIGVQWVCGGIGCSRYVVVGRRIGVQWRAGRIGCSGYVVSL